MPPTGGLLVTTIFLGCCCFELAQAVAFVALDLHISRSNMPAEGIKQHNQFKVQGQTWMFCVATFADRSKYDVDQGMRAKRKGAMLNGEQM